MKMAKTDQICKFSFAECEKYGGLSSCCNHCCTGVRYIMLTALFKCLTIKSLTVKTVFNLFAIY